MKPLSPSRSLSRPPLPPSLPSPLFQDEELEEGHSGEFGGKKYFSCPPRCGIILPFGMLKRDDRFDSGSPEVATRELKLSGSNNDWKGDTPSDERDSAKPILGDNISPGVPQAQRTERSQNLSQESTPIAPMLPEATPEHPISVESSPKFQTSPISKQLLQLFADVLGDSKLIAFLQLTVASFTLF